MQEFKVGKRYKRSNWAGQLVTDKSWEKGVVCARFSPGNRCIEIVHPVTGGAMDIVVTDSQDRRLYECDEEGNRVTQRPKQVTVSLKKEVSLRVDFKDPLSPFKEDAHKLGWDWNTSQLFKGPILIDHYADHWRMHHKKLGILRIQKDLLGLMRLAEEAFDLNT